MNIQLKIACIFLIAFLSTFFLIRYYIPKARKKRYTVKDVYKPANKFVPTMGGLTILAGLVLGLVVAEFFAINMVPLLIFYFIVIVFGLYGLTDDLFGFRKKLGKVLVLYILALPIAILTHDTQINFGSLTFELGYFYAFVLAPIYVMVVANLVNMHSGYNGLSGGLTTILFAGAGIKSYLLHGFSEVFLLMPVFGALLGFMYYNFYPARLFMGNVGSFLIGSALGAFLVISKLEWFGIIALTPHIIDLGLFVFIKLSGRRFVKFGATRKDGTIAAPDPFKLKAFFPHYFRMSEPRAVLLLYGITLFFILIAFLVT